MVCLALESGSLKSTTPLSPALCPEQFRLQGKQHSYGSSAKLQFSRLGLHLRITGAVFNTLPLPLHPTPAPDESQRMGLGLCYCLNASPGETDIQPGLGTTELPKPRLQPQRFITPQRWALGHVTKTAESTRGGTRLATRVTFRARGPCPASVTHPGMDSARPPVLWARLPPPSPARIDPDVRVFFSLPSTLPGHRTGLESLLHGPPLP